MIFNLLQIEKIPRLKPILEENEHFECKISIKSQIDKVTKLINNVLKNDSTNLQLFKESPFGHFLDLSNNYEHSSQVMWLLLIREADCDRDSEMWFVVNGVPIRFSLMEYALISGLKCSEYPEGWETQAKSNAFKDRHFRGKEIVSIDDVKAKFTHMSNPNQSNRVRRNLNVSNKEILKMASLLFVSAALMHRNKSSSNIDSLLLGLVDDLDMFNQYPWGTYSYEYALKQLRKGLKGKAKSVHEKAKTMSTFTYSGFVLPLAVRKLP